MHSNYVFSGDSGAEEIFVCQCGEEICQPSHAFGPAEREYYLIHFVVSGCGTLYAGGNSWPVRAGQGFLILPEEETFYQADEQSPWHYAWVGYRGRQAERITRSAGLDATHRVFTVQDSQAVWNTLTQLREDARRLRLGQMAAAGSLLRFLALIAPPADTHQEQSSLRAYCDKAIWYLEGRYDRPVSIQETADFVGLSRSHLYRVMLEGCGCSPKEMLLRIRMRHAAQLLESTALTLDEIAHRIGLQTGAQLGVAFRRMYGATPGQYRKGKS